MNEESIQKISKVKLVEYQEGKLEVQVINKDGSLVFSKKVTACNRELGHLTIQLKDEDPATPATPAGGQAGGQGQACGHVGH